jgi:hypothetical protein
MPPNYALAGVNRSVNCRCHEVGRSRPSLYSDIASHAIAAERLVRFALLPPYMEVWHVTTQQRV